MLKAYKYRLYPNKKQEILIQKTFGCCRFVYNQTLAHRKEMYETILFGTKCDGHKERCTLRPAYSTLERTVKNYQHNYNGDRKHGSGAKTQRKVEPLIPFGTLSDDGDSDTLPFM